MPEPRSALLRRQASIIRVIFTRFPVSVLLLQCLNAFPYLCSRVDVKLFKEAMAEGVVALGAAAGALQICDVALRCAREIRGFLVDLKDTSKDVQHLRSGIGHTSALYLILHPR